MKWGNDGMRPIPERREHHVVWVSTYPFAEHLVRHDERREEGTANRCMLVRLNLTLFSLPDCLVTCILLIFVS